MGFLEVSAKIDSYREAAIELERELVAIPALSPDYNAPPEQTGEARKVAFLKRYLADHGIDGFTDINAPDERAPEGVRPRTGGRGRPQPDPVPQ